MKNVDVIIPTYHPGNDFYQLLKRLDQQTRPIHRILVMNTEESGWKPEWEKEFKQLQVYHLQKSDFDHGGTRKKAAELSLADFMIFMTQDALPVDEYLVEHLLKPLEADEKVGAAYARQLPKQDCRFIECYTRSFNYPSVSSVKWEKDTGRYGIKTYFCSNVCAAYNKEIYKEVGGFVDRAIFNEDMIYAGNMAKKGYGIAYQADACVYHSHNYSCCQQFHRNFDLGVSQAEHPEIFDSVPSEGEGMKLVKQTLGYLLKSGHIWLVPQLVLQSGSKYLGYKMGKGYRKLSPKTILKCTMNREYWKRKE